MYEKMSIAEAFNHLGELMEYMKRHQFDEKQIKALSIARNALVTIELLGITALKNTVHDPCS